MLSRAAGVLEGKRVLVVGASSGIGRSTARSLAASGAVVAVAARRRELLDSLVVEMGTGTPVAADLRVPEQCLSLVEQAVAALGSIDAMVFSASASSLARIKDADAATWKATMETNVIAPALVTGHVLPYLSDGAFLAYLSSEVVGQPYHGLVHYGCSKAALEELVRGLRAEHPELRFCCLRVGATVGTDFHRDFSAPLSAELFPEWVAAGKIPARLMDSDEVGSAIAASVAMALATPGIDVQDLTLRPPGGPFTGDAARLVEGLDG